MSYYQSNYPSYGGGGGYGAYGGYTSSGPPPPPQGYGGYGGYSAYNVNQSAYNQYQMGTAPPPPTGGYGGGYGANPFQAIQGCYQQYQSNPQYQQQHWQPPPPPPAPQGMVDKYNQQMYQNQWYAQQQMKEQLQQQMGIKKKKKKGRKQRRRVEEDDEEDEEEEEEEDDVDPDVEAMLKERLRTTYIDELMRRLKVSGTLDITQGTIGAYARYEPEDPVFKFMASKGEDLSENPKWDPECDVQYLRDAMKGLGTNEDAITHVLTTRNNAQRQQLKKMFKTAYGRDLIEDVESELSGDYRSAIMALFVPPAVYDAYCIKEAIYGPGTDEASLIEIFMTRTNPQIQELRAVYGDVASPHRKVSGTLIEKDIEGDTSGDFKQLLVAAAQGNRNEITREQLEKAVEEIEVDGKGTGMFQVNYSKLADMKKAKRDAEKLYKAGEDKWGTDEEEFIRIFSTRDYYQLRATWDEYVKLTQRDITNSVDRETSGDFRSGLKAIAQNIKCRPKYFAQRLKKAIKGLGTDDKTLIRIIVSRAEIDMVQIKKEFLAMTDQTLWKWIHDDTSGDYRKVLLALVGKN
ncbi:annexin A5-like [Saccostrea echinata]|uniref:annexin A5-like n=1 Tax=Saccostrea echinata TaxID=191078 RepID=UPI002A7ED29D|nr:annexin A5-like [Saccostrea echinata]